MAKVVVTERAFDDANTILNDIEAAAGRITALKFRARITSLFDRLERIRQAVRHASDRAREFGLES